MNIPSEQIQELIAGSVLGDLSDVEREQLDSIDTEQYSEFIWELHQTAASVDLACATESPDPLPAELRAQIKAAAPKYIGGASAQLATSEPARGSEAVARAIGSSAATTASGWNIREVVAWAACAAALLLCVNLTWKTSPQPLPPAEARAALLNSSDNVMTVAWAAGPSEAPDVFGGDVVWDNGRQEGYMRLIGLPVNDPSVEQYQLWIIDPDRDDEPIDGGVFNIDSDGEAVIPIDAKLPVVSPAAFAVTIEKPGGVVVSTQERLPLLAAVK
ncbi:MAG: hypothetical protein Aurels2KO_03520 [Aureliella sp.]